MFASTGVGCDTFREAGWWASDWEGTAGRLGVRQSIGVDGALLKKLVIAGVLSLDEHDR